MERNAYYATKCEKLRLAACNLIKLFRMLILEINVNRR